MCLSCVVLATGLILAVPAAFGQGPPGGRRGGRPTTDPAMGQAAVSAPQPAPTPDEKKCLVQGRVVNSLTGEPLKKAEITLRRSNSTGDMGAGRNSPAAFARYSATTDTQGMFTIDKIEPGSYRLSCKRTGFLSGEYGAKEPQQAGTPITLTERQQMTDLMVKLTRQAVLSGTVFDDDGDPLEGATVQVFTPKYTRGKRTLAPVDNAETDDRGQYRVPDIAPGKYVLMATPPASGGSRRGMPMPVNTAAAAPDSSLSSVYYPSVPDESQAAKLDVTAGSDIGGLDMRLVKTRTFRVSGKVVDATSGGPVRGAMLALFASSGMAINRLRTFVRGQDGSFEIPGVPAGSYLMMVNGGGGPGGPGQDRRSSPVLVPVEVRGGNLDNLLVSVGPGQSMTGTVTVEGDQQPSLSGVSVSVLPQIAIPVGSPSGRVGKDGGFQLDGVQPGKYSVNVSGLPAGSYVKAIKVGALDVLGTDFDVAGAAGTLQITLSMAGGQVAGTVQNKDAPAAGATVVLIPEESMRGVAMFYKTGTTGESGAFSITGVAPGDYTVYAWETIESGAWQNPDILRMVDGRGERAKVAASATETVQLKLIPELQ